MNKPQAGLIVFRILLVFVIIALIAGIGYYVWNHDRHTNEPSNNSSGSQNNSSTSGAINSFDQCQKAAGSIVQQTYPEVCITEGGQRFTQVVPFSSQ
ncbi:MAG TPA: hypothetical protein VHD84_03150 [Candidatus Saccharimonadales bacterium]|nr:hypothetical protein [Candidatus Saccharimonadales bacterium]